MIKYYIRKIKHRIPLLSKNFLNILQAKYPRARFFVRNILKVEMEKILVGDIHGITSFDWCELTGDSSRLEEKIADSPYFELFDAINKGNFNEGNVKNFRYFKLAILCIKEFKEYCGCKNEKELIAYLFCLKRYFFDYKKRGNDGSGLFVKISQIKDTDFYEIIDGHHRVAMDAILGKKYVYGFVVGASFSGIQEKLFRVSMTKRKELYQPIDNATVKNWPTIRNCKDRLAMASDFLKKSEKDLSCLSLIDIACSYGYFVKAFNCLGIKSKGLEIDRNAIEIGKISYGLQDKDFIQSSLQKYLKKTSDQYDVVCLFSILHHFGLKKDFGGGGISMRELINKIDKMTKKYLFLDSGQKHEYWFKNKLIRWNDEFIARFVMENSNFKSFEKLGADEDNVGKYAGNYHRTLFVFKK